MLLRVRLFFGIISIFLFFPFSVVYAQIAERFSVTGQLDYEVYFNGKKSGSVEWHYLGRQACQGKEAELLKIDSDTKILSFFDLTSHEKIYLAVDDYLPLRVERDLVVFGNKEQIVETYYQDQDYVGIVKSSKGDKKQSMILRQKAPIRHIMALLYFFPAREMFKPGETMDFNLPTCSVHIRVDSLREIDIQGIKRKAWLLIGTGGKRFNLWIDEEKKYPVRIEFLFPAGKISIIEKKN